MKRCTSGPAAAGLLAWLLLAPCPAAAATPEACHDASMLQRAQQRLNALRTTGLRCGSDDLAAVEPLLWSDRLARAAEAKAADMAEQGQMSHEGSDGSRGGERILRAGFNWWVWAENLGVGARSVDELLRLWMSSPGHCANLMHRDAQMMGLACATGRDGRPYWALELATPR